MAAPLAWLAASCAAFLVPLAQAPVPLPFDKAGREVLEQADRGRGKGAALPGELRARFEPLHERVRLGAFELWVPERALNDRLAAKPGPGAKEVQALVADLVALQGAWIERVNASDEEREEARQALEVLASWSAREFKGARFPEPGAEQQAARERIERHFFRRVLGPNTYALVVVLAPTRAQYLGMLGAASLVDPPQRGRLCDEGQRRSQSAQLVPGVMLIATTAALEGERADPLRDQPLEAIDARQLFVHSASHLMTVDALPTAPGWWGEGLALCDTIRVCKADESVCTGHSEHHAGSNLPGVGGLSGILLWVTRQKSPYREGPSSAWFEMPLRNASNSDGLTVFDLDRGEIAGRVTLPLLGEDSTTPALIATGAPGLKKGYAELYRAWCGAFVHWLDTQPGKQRSLLVELCGELSRIPWEPGLSRFPLYELASRVTGRTLGAVTDPASDLEAAFAATLRR